MDTNLPIVTDSAQTIEKPAAVLTDNARAISLNEALERLLGLLNLLGICQTPNWRCCFSWLLVIVVSAVTVLHSNKLEWVIWISPTCQGVASFVCITPRLAKAGLRRLLLIDREDEQLTDQYIQKISGCSDMLVWLSLPLFGVKLSHESISAKFAPDKLGWSTCAILLSRVILWTYLNAVSLAACMLFYLVCSLQAVNFEDYTESLKRQLDVGLLLKEHRCLRGSLCKVGHGFQVFLLSTFSIVTASIYATTLILFKHTDIDGVDLAVTSSVQAVGLSLCLAGAFKIQHTARNVAVVALEWRDELTNHSSRSHLSPRPNLEAFNSSYIKRDAFVNYLKYNPRGLSIYGWGIGMFTILVMELSLFLVLMGRVLFGG